MSIEDVLANRGQWHVECADVRSGLALLPDNSVHVVCTSPPYFGVRAYGTEPQDWGDWVGELGSEKDPTSFVCHLVEIFRDVKRGLRPDGTCWINIGDSYWTRSAMRQGGNREQIRAMAGDIEMPSWAEHAALGRVRYSSGHATLKDKDLCLVPERLAIALQDDGWWLRQIIIWDKPACMPESVTDRCTTSHEYIFLLSKSKTYYFDADAIREGVAESSKARVSQNGGHPNFNPERERGFPGASQTLDIDRLVPAGGRNKRSVWRIATEPLREAHFAAYPTALVKPMVLAGTSAYGVCSACGAPWRRVTERTTMVFRPSERQITKRESGLRTALSGTMLESPTSVTTGWEPTCKCNAAVVPAIVLDPFCGSGTTLIEALRHGRRAIGIDLNPTYEEMAKERIVSDAPLFNGASTREALQ